jgi:hypothetical protein
MLEESSKLINNIRAQQKLREINRARRVWYLRQIKYWGKVTVITAITGTILLFPEQSGRVIGKFINQFFGTIIKETLK